MRHQITCIIALLLCTSLAFAQYPDITYEGQTIRKQAERITIAYDKQLGLDGDQYPIFFDKVKDYLVLADKAKKNLEGKEELDALTELMVEETLEMQDLLTREQYVIYKKVRQEIQPIKVVKEKSK